VTQTLQARTVLVQIDNNRYLYVLNVTRRTDLQLKGHTWHPVRLTDLQGLVLFRYDMTKIKTGPMSLSFPGNERLDTMVRFGHRWENLPRDTQTDLLAGLAQTVTHWKDAPKDIYYQQLAGLLDSLRGRPKVVIKVLEDAP
jgi:hypothetical protein